MERFFIETKYGRDLAEKAGFKTEPCIGFICFRYNSGEFSKKLQPYNEGTPVKGFLVYAESKAILTKNGVICSNVGESYTHELAKGNLETLRLLISMVLEDE